MNHSRHNSQFSLINLLLAIVILNEYVMRYCHHDVFHHLHITVKGKPYDISRENLLADRTSFKGRNSRLKILFFFPCCVAKHIYFV